MKLRFTIRDLFWLMAVVAVLTAWGLDQARTSAYYAAREGAWTIAVGAQPLSTQEELRKAHKEAFDHLRGNDQ
jgi:hypothetical protein